MAQSLPIECMYNWWRFPKVVIGDDLNSSPSDGNLSRANWFSAKVHIPAAGNCYPRYVCRVCRTGIHHAPTPCCMRRPRPHLRPPSHTPCIPREKKQEPVSGFCHHGAVSSRYPHGLSFSGAITGRKPSASRHEPCLQCWFTVGQASATLAQQ